MRRPKPTWRDVWAWAAVAALLPLVAFTRGAPRGEAVAEDFDFLQRALLAPSNSLLDGGGSSAFWRPLSHQLYYELFGELILNSPRMIAAIHLVLLGVAVVLLYRVFREWWPGPVAAAAASFPLLAESTRTLVCWPSHFVDLGAFLFSALALHEAAFRRLPTALLALVAALLCKEVALLTALLLPFMPGVADDRRGRLRVLVGCGLVAVAWAAVYLWVRRHAGLELPHGLERDPALLATPLPARLMWAVWNSLRASFSLSLAPGPLDAPVAIATLALLGVAAFVLTRDAAARRRLAGARPWLVWGGVWCVVGWAGLATIFPLWAPNRSQFGSLGLGVGAVVLAGAAHPGLVAGLVIVRLGAFALAPGTPATISVEPDRRGAFMDYTRLCRLQRLMQEARARLDARYRFLPRGATIGFHTLPLSAEYAFGGPLAVQAWYRDTTLRWIDYDDFKLAPQRPVTTFLSYQVGHSPEVVLLDPDALRMQLAGLDDLRAGRWSQSIAALDRADSLLTDTAAVVFRGDNAGRRAYCWARLLRWDRAEPEARRALAIAREDVGARYVIALTHAARHQFPRAEAQLDTLLAMAPDHEEAKELRTAIAQAEQLERKSVPVRQHDRHGTTSADF